MNLLDFQPGDIVCFADHSFVSRAIRWCERTKGEAPSKCSHVGVMYDDKLICESLSTVKIHPIAPRIEQYVRQGGWVDVFRARELVLAENVSAVQMVCRHYQGRRYGTIKIVAHALDRALGGRYLFRRLCCLKNYPICSWLVAYAFEPIRFGYFGQSPKAVQPDDIHDWCMAQVNLFDLVASFGTYGVEA